MSGIGASRESEGRPIVEAMATPTTIRPARVEDYGAFVRLFPELGTNDPIVDRERFDADFVPTTLVAEAGSGGPVAGYAYFETIDAATYVRHLVTAPEARRLGVGRALMEAIVRRARSEGARTWCLNVEPGNVAAIALYEKMGLAPAFASRATRIAWSAVEAPSASDSLRVAARRIDAEEDAAVEAAFGLMSGQLAVARNKGDRVVLVLEDEANALVGAAVFHPHFPGAYPFHVTRPELAVPFLRAIRAHARATDTFVNVMIEGQPNVAAMLVAAGAVVRLEVIHMKGLLPEVRHA